MNNLIGRKIRGFKFEDINIGYLPIIDSSIGEVGEISLVLDDRVRVDFKENSWYYPLDQIEKHLISEKNEIQELGEGVLMEVSDYKSFKVSVNGLVIGKYKGLFVAGSEDCVNSWRYARPIKEKVVLTHKQIAEKFDVDINQLEIEK